MSTTRNVAVIVGSLRKESFNRKMANALIAMAPAPLKLTIHEIGQLPLYNQDLDTASPRRSGRRSATASRGRRTAVRHARIQPVDARRPQERDRRRLAAAWPQCMERQARRA